MNDPAFSKTRCRSCDAPIIWAVTKEQKRMPLDRAPTDDGNMAVFVHGDTLRTCSVVDVQAPPGRREPGLYTSHFVTCPDAGKWRRK